MFKPDYILESVCDITEEFIAKNNIKALILDIDNTLAVPDKRFVPQDILSWLDKIKQSETKLVILSNNTPERIKDFAEHIGLPYVGNALKPKKDGYIEATKLIQTDICHCACVGDQLFTDIWGGNRSGGITILTKPFEKDQTFFITLKRIIEKPFLMIYNGKGSKQK